jgi:hypothetical protein
MPLFVDQVVVRIDRRDAQRALIHLDDVRGARELFFIDLLDLARVGDIDRQHPRRVVPVLRVVAPVLGIALGHGVQHVADDARVGDFALDFEAADFLRLLWILHVDHEQLTAVEALRIGVAVELPVHEVVAHHDVRFAVAQVHVDGLRLKWHAADHRRLIGLCHVDEHEPAVAVSAFAVSKLVAPT